jgi:translation initiation factor eIF-2B subunit gamma
MEHPIINIMSLGKAKCLLPVGNLPLVWYPLNMLQSAGWSEATVIVPDSARQEVSKIPERYNLSIKLDIVGIPGQQELGTADSLRLISEKLTATDIVIVSGDLMVEEGMRGMVDMHRMNNAAFTAMLAKPMFDMKNVVVPGAKSTKHKKGSNL